jgi:hypothetical protein
MSHDDPFTLDLFGNTALSSGLGVGVTAFSMSFPDSPADDDPPPSSPSPAMPIAAVAQPFPTAPAPKGDNFHLSATRDLAKSWRDRARDNLTAIRLAADIVDQQRPATPEDQAALIRFTGFGASELVSLSS